MGSTRQVARLAIVGLLVLAPLAHAEHSADSAKKNRCGHRLEVRVVDARNTPLPGARVQFVWVTPPEGAPLLDGSGQVNIEHYVIPYPEQIADARGVVVCEHCCTTNGSHDVFAESPGLARGVVHGLGLDSLVVLRLGIGATVRGRVTRDGKPVSGARVMMVGGNEAITDADGFYEYSLLVPQSSYLFYTPMDHGNSAGATLSCYVEAGRTGTTTLAPDLRVGPVHTLRGVLLPPPGMSFPERTLLFWSRTIESQRGRDSYYERPYLYVDPAGRFEITGLPEQTVQLEFTYPGWAFSRNAPQPFRRNVDGSALIWKVKSDLVNVRIPLVYEPPKPAPYSGWQP